MKTLTKTIITGLSALLLSGCSMQITKGTPDCFSYQSDYTGFSISSLTECGPTTAAIAICNTTGQRISRKIIRKHYFLPLWWRLDHIQKVTQLYGADLTKESWSYKTTLGNIRFGEYLILHVDRTHFVTVFKPAGTGARPNEELTVWDTNNGIYFTTVERLAKRVSYYYFLRGQTLEQSR